MLPLAGRPLLARLLERVKRCQWVHELVVATTTHSEDDVLAHLASAEGVRVFRGSEHDVVDRYVQAARSCGADVIARLPADNPVPEPTEIDRIITAHLSGSSHFSSNLAEVYGNGYPNGIGAEVFHLTTLEEVWRACTDPERREHPHLNFFDYARQRPADPMRYRIGTVACPGAFRRPDLVLDVNTRAEYAFMASLYDTLYPKNPSFHITDIIRWYDAECRRVANSGSGVQACVEHPAV